MTEQEWLASNNLDELLRYQTPQFGRADKRKLQLFGCACNRRIWHLLEDNLGRLAVEEVEKFADHQGSQEQLATILLRQWPANRPPANVSRLTFDVHKPTVANTVHIADACITALGASAGLSIEERNRIRPNLEAAGLWERQAQLALLRDIFGNPFRAVTIDSTWLTPAVVTFAQVIYEERAFEQLPILADVLEEAGCTNFNVLNHCRLPGEHARGCWVLDLMLNEE